jgi:hypothetical protein
MLSGTILTECHILFINMLNLIMLSVIMLCVVMLGVIMLSVVAPFNISFPGWYFLAAGTEFILNSKKYHRSLKSKCRDG